MKTRKQIDNRYKWDTTDIFKTEEEFYATAKELEGYTEVMKNYKGRLGSRDDLLSFFHLSVDAGKKFSLISAYASLNHCEDIEKSKYNDMTDFVSQLANKYSVATAFVSEELLSLNEDYLKSILADEDFSDFKMDLENLIRAKAHTLSEKEEIIVSKATLSLSEFSNVFERLTTLDIKFKKPVDSEGKKYHLDIDNIGDLLESKDRVLRKNAFTNFYKAISAFNNTLAANFIGSLKSDSFIADVYKYSSVLQQNLYASNIPEKVYSNLLTNVNNYLPLLHEYFAVKKQTLGVESLEYYDSYVSTAKFEKNYNFDESFDTVKKALAVFGKEYTDILQKSLDERWMDVYPTKNKDSGAFSMALYPVHPYVMLNTRDSLVSMFTLAHELGHALNAYFSSKNQTYNNSGNDTFVAEVASTTNEVLLLKYLYNNAKNDDEKIYYLEKYLRDFKSTLFRQTMFSEFEYFVHSKIEKGEQLNKDLLNRFYGELNRRYHGDALTHSNYINYEWSRIPHFFSPYYVYTYSTGYVSAVSLAYKILNNIPKAKEKYLKFLKAGSSKYPYEILKEAGVDLTENEPFEIAFEEMRWALNQLKKLTKNRK